MNHVHAANLAPHKCPRPEIIVSQSKQSKSQQSSIQKSLSAIHAEPLTRSQLTAIRSDSNITYRAHHMGWQLREREREKEIHYVHSASLAYEDGIVFMSKPAAARQ